MKTLKYLGILIVVLSLSGCIIVSATPEQTEISMDTGDSINFTIVASSMGYQGSIVQSWYVNGIKKPWTTIDYIFTPLSSGTYEIEGRVNIVRHTKTGDKIVATESRFWTVTVD
jgi:hypothetical protein